MSAITIDLDEKHAALLAALKGQSGADAAELVGTALELLADVALGNDHQPPLSAEQIAAIEEGLAALARGEIVDHEDVAAELRDKYGR